ncbi:DUF262 domain-containing protein [Flavobacterium yafengii]|jgi:hypothetical protein|uniref:DUF262 domain-containing protein n=1 Tax=Flavobacterium yafengii TaxID=3041253 RepID=A0AAW6TI62_9FLAO|nr:DUF262 domain-containing protein [Flavobacterium yafengii]MDI5949174.1 DUF262 domain-containing protein [Flavobacterium yafengii]
MKSYTLREISQWQKEVSGEETKISLPSLQRGFVWKPEQIEALWDSIFRGYPIGAIMMSVDKENNRFLLDGQQRSTSIALGHFNPFDNNSENFLSLKTYKPSVWIDLNTANATETQKFTFRCLTQSHPWGYQLKVNSNSLSMQDRRNANTFFNRDEKVERYTDLKSDKINPWDSKFPIPLSFILEETTENFIDFKSSIINKTKELNIKTKHSGNEYVDFDEVVDEDLNKIFLGFLNYKRLQIPEIAVNAEVLNESENNIENESQDPTLFVRLNSAGTRISGEELIYSIYKASFPKIKDLVENIGASYISPSKVIGIFSRLVSCEQNNYNSFQKEFTVVNFRKKVQEEEFKKLLNNYIGNATESKANQLIENAIEILKKGMKNIPNILIKQWVLTNIDLFYVLIIYLNKYDFVTLSNEEKNDIASTYIYTLWFNRDGKKIASNLFNSLLKNDTKVSWKIALSDLTVENLVIPVITPKLLKENLERIVIERRVNFNHFDVIRDEKLLDNEVLKILQNDSDDINIANTNWDSFIHQLYGNKSMLLFAQRDYMNSKFKEFNQIENIDDTNRPWDWDHIYPNSWVYNNKGIDELVKRWVNSIGNFRALSYDDNRSESNTMSPKARFEKDDKKEESFIKDDYVFWNQIDSSFNRIKNSDPEKTKLFLNAVISRMVNIYADWYENYYINIS